MFPVVRAGGVSVWRSGLGRLGLLVEQDPVAAVLGVPELRLRELGRPIRARPGPYPSMGGDNR